MQVAIIRLRKTEQICVRVSRNITEKLEPKYVDIGLVLKYYDMHWIFISNVLNILDTFA